MGVGGGLVCGVDEVGRGPLAGPVTAAAVILPEPCPVTGLADSKQLSPARRERLYSELVAAGALIGVGWATVAEIDRLNILQAALLAMSRAVAALPVVPGHALIDGRFVPAALPCSATALVRGDSTVPAISAASIIAKVTRDRAMVELARRYPGYGWEVNNGYPTAAHRAALLRLGITPEHRRTFNGVRELA